MEFTIIEETSETLEKLVNDFIKGKKIISISFTEVFNEDQYSYKTAYFLWEKKKNV